MENRQQRNYTDQNKTKRREPEYNDEALALFIHLKPLMNLWRALMSALDREFEPSKKPLPQPQIIKGFATTEEVLDSLQLFFIATYPALIRLESVPDPRQRPNMAVPRDKIIHTVI